jgi:hypothetical protein
VDDKGVADRRSFARMRLDSLVLEGLGASWHIRRVADVSPGGLLLEGSGACAPRTHVTIVFLAPDGGEPITLVAEVVATTERGTHVRFVESAGVTPRDRCGIRLAARR